MTDVVAQDEIKLRLLFSFYLCQRLTSPNYAFMRRRLYSKRKVKSTSQILKIVNKFEYSYEFAECMMIVFLSYVSTVLHIYSVQRSNSQLRM